MKNIYELREVKFSYGGRQVLDIGSLAIETGGVVGLVGPNGGGKSTLLKLLAFLASPSSGEIIFRGEKTAGREREMRRDVTLLLQDHYLLRESVRDNVAYGLKLRGVPKDEREALVNESLARVGLRPEEFAGRKWFGLSGGEARRVSLAARIALRPKVLLLDEPTANVDEASAEMIKSAVMSARDDGSTVVAATHDLPWLSDVATEVIGMYGGRPVPGAANLIHGEWRLCAGEQDIAVLETGGTVLRAYAPQRVGEKKCAALDPSDVKIFTGGAADEENFSETGEFLNRASGVVTQTSLERRTGEILVAIDCGGVILRARVSPGEAAAKQIYPGARVRAAFKISSLRFV